MEIKPVALFVVAFIVIIVGLVVIQQSASNIESIDTSDSNETSNFTYTSPTTLTAQEGITSNSISVLENGSFMNFDGVNDYVNVSNIINSTDFSISIWINLQGNKSTGYIIDNDGLSGVINRSWVIRTGTINPKGIIFTMTNTTYYSSPTEFILSNGEWYHIGFTYNTTTQNYSVYYNGILNDTRFFPEVNNTLSRTPKIGSSRAIGNYFLGSIDELRWYNYTLNESQFTEIYNSGRNQNSSLPSDGLVLWYGFNENNGTIVNDLSGNNNNGI